MGVLEKLDTYAPHLLPDVSTYSMIVDTAIKGGRLQSSEGPRFVERVLERAASRINALRAEMKRISASQDERKAAP